MGRCINRGCFDKGRAYRLGAVCIDRGRINKGQVYRCDSQACVGGGSPTCLAFVDTQPHTTFHTLCLNLAYEAAFHPYAASLVYSFYVLSKLHVNNRLQPVSNWL